MARMTHVRWKKKNNKPCKNKSRSLPKLRNLFLLNIKEVAENLVQVAQNRDTWQELRETAFSNTEK